MDWKVSTPRLQPSILHEICTLQVFQCSLRTSYLNTLVHSLQLNSVLLICCITKRFTFFPRFKVCLQLGHVLFFCAHYAIHVPQKSLVQSMHSFGDSTTWRQIVQLKKWSRSTTAYSGYKCLSESTTGLSFYSSSFIRCVEGLKVLGSLILTIASFPFTSST